ncbi:cobalamin synthase [Lysobacter daejeonensis GH1-9]|uniref:Adenosylcobinamide-GDP ribazoletransferase n=1 Tax=Lysobacter daejeonensis GH1-9 TaxID=1385517 RepID=A0A0A0EVS7_9GAMM|nr:adenosylcobinamide-GDP ribazoletransferase [Lysobacter daejeonensis]KGM54634.1 cobalamin synthase [Lysobacter daejeonensis GH1-9]
MVKPLLVALGFLTRLPVPSGVFDDARAQARSLACYPLVGAILGGLLVGLASLLHGVPPLLVAALLLTWWVASTGALHLDGLADSADAWVGGLGDRERTLSIMKDPRSGPMAVAAVVLLLLLKFAALASLPASAWGGLLLAPLLGRAALTLAFLTTPYARAQGLGTGLRAAPRALSAAAVLLAAGVAIAFGQAGLVALVAAIVVFLLWRRACMQRLGGFTGDTAGALAECVEAAVLVAWVASVG